MAKRIKTTRVIDAGTGEVLHENKQTVYTMEAYIPGEGYRLYAKKGIRLGKGIPQLENNAKGLLLTMIEAMDEVNVIPDVAALLILSGLSRRRVYQLIEYLRGKGVIAKAGSSYVMSPAVAFTGVYLSPQLYRLFQKQMESIIPAWAKAEYEKEARHGSIPTVGKAETDQRTAGDNVSADGGRIGEVSGHEAAE